jgi:hypothetical protein
MTTLLQFEKAGQFFKVDDELGIAYGWAIICSENEAPYFDLQGDHIPEDAMVSALADFAKNSRVGKDQHQGEQAGEHVFLYPITKGTAIGLGITTARRGAIVGYQPANRKDLDAITTGARTGFSIGGELLTAEVMEYGKEITVKDAAGVEKAASSGPGVTDGKKKGRVFRTFKIREISLVDRPAQEGATVGFVKHVIATVNTDKSEASVREPDLTSKDAASSVTSSTMSQEPKMTEQEIAQLKTRAEIAESSLARLTKMAELTDAQKTYLGRLSATDQTAFLAKSVGDRDAEVKAAVVHTGADGTLYFRNDDQRLVNAVKANETLAKSMSEQSNIAKSAQHESFAKSTIGALAGDEPTKIAIAKAVSSIEDEKVRTAVIETLKAANAAVAWLSQASGHDRVSKATQTAEGSFYKAASEFAKSSNMPNGTDVEKAKVTAAFIKTPDGAQLYREYVATTSNNQTVA